MTTLREAAQQALEALDAYSWEQVDAARTALRAALVEDAMQKFTDVNQELEAALAEPQTWVCPDSAEHRYQKPGHCEDCGKTLVQVAAPVQKPVAWIHTDPEKGRVKFLEWRENEPGYRGDWIKTPLYAAPPQRKPLSNVDLAKIWDDALDQLDPRDQLRFVARAIERAHGIDGAPEERHFCPRCGKRTNDIHTCTPP